MYYFIQIINKMNNMDGEEDLQIKIKTISLNYENFTHIFSIANRNLY